MIRDSLDTNRSLTSLQLSGNKVGAYDQSSDRTRLALPLKALGVIATALPAKQICLKRSPKLPCSGPLGADGFVRGAHKPHAKGGCIPSRCSSVYLFMF